MDQKKFQRKIEDFACQNCGFSVKGNGYTDHCSKCLWSKHVDINPGDRKEECQGMMRPIDIEMKNKKRIIHYVCENCGYSYQVKSASDDNFEKILEIIKSKNEI